MSKTIILIASVAVLLGGCDAGSSDANRSTGVYMLLDTSGTYAEEVDKAQQIINFTLSRLNPGDSFAVARIDTGSFSEKDIVAKVTFADRPSTTNSQKRQFRDDVTKFIDDIEPARYTDISGGLLQAVEFLAEKDPGQKTILIFSDLQEDLQEGYIRDFSIPFDNTVVIALNVTKLRSDNIDPRDYMDRLAAWRARVEQSGGSWRVINDLDRMEKLFG